MVDINKISNVFPELFADLANASLAWRDDIENPNLQFCLIKAVDAIVAEHKFNFYGHHVCCSGDRRKPVGQPGHSCSCKSILKWIEEQERLKEEKNNPVKEMPLEERIDSFLSDMAFNSPNIGESLTREIFSEEQIDRMVDKIVKKLKETSC